MRLVREYVERGLQQTTGHLSGPVDIYMCVRVCRALNGVGYIEAFYAHRYCTLRRLYGTHSI